MYNPIKTIISVLIIATFKFMPIFANSKIVLASSRFTSNYSYSDTGRVYRKRCIKTNGEKRITIGNSKRDPGGNAMIGILKLIVFCIFYLSLSGKVIATSYRDPTSKTNVNVQTDLFRKSVGDVQAFKSQIQEEEREAIEKLRSSGDHGVEFIAGSSRKEIDENTAELSTIRADELNDRGRTRLLKENLLEEIYVDESNPLMVAHRKDAEKIAEGSKDLLESLLLSLKERLGVDCYTVKGNKEIEPEHRIALKEEQIKETVYDQTICEDPRNKYNCHDALTLRCTKRGIRFGPWQNRQIVISGSELFNTGKSVFLVKKTGSSCFEYQLELNPIFHPHPYHVANIREFLVTKHPGSTIDNIYTEMSSGWGGSLFSLNGLYYCGRRLGSKDYGWTSYTVYYQYKESYHVCEQWSEDWSETCILQ